MYNLKISKKQAKVISKALDLYSRIGSGQTSEILWHPSVIKKIWDKKDKSENQENQKIVKQLLDGIKKIIWNYGPNEHGGIGMAEEVDKIAYDLHQVIRHKIAWEENPKGGITVNFHKPMKWSKEELAKMENDNKCPCGGYMNDWHSHASDCIEVNSKQGKQY